MKLEKNAILLNQHVRDKKAAIELAGKALVNNNYVDKKYIGSMLKRENTVSTYIGNYIAIPHGVEGSQNQIIQSGISFVQVPEGVNFGSRNEKKPVHILFGIAGKQDEHLDLLSEIAIFCSDMENVQRLIDAKSESEVQDLLGGVVAC